ncbi:hypothetical protein IWQ56_003402 [Coemansia nantahalensis]|uniref:Uncharacterized protein n=2 Tax=Coemansia TaxID=4863 RepID=A0ACC1L6J7_9FUNG|nr:hypothetical protein IWQ57_006803 [Coemansia nantahalensis]KAJ2767261.1 hypothetical protein IWQ56_003402 [Coemansia nantahalensis]KAJ2801806.1 hypothetical protein H4R21_002659 [Coemansia helicoidea]
MKSTAKHALAKEVAEYEAIRDRLPYDAASQVQRLLVSEVITAGHALMDLKPLQEWHRLGEEYEDLLDEHLDNGCLDCKDRDREDVASLKARMEVVRSERDKAKTKYEEMEGTFVVVAGRFEATKREYLNYVRSQANSAVKE